MQAVVCDRGPVPLVVHVRCLAALVLLVVAAATSSAEEPRRTSPAWANAEQQLQLALEAQTAGEFDTMLRLLRQSAAQGHVEAQELLGWALLVGPTLYGRAVKTDRCEAGLWLREALVQGSAVAKLQLDFLNRLRHSPSGKDVCQAWGG
ncbi:MAG: sel1 repeat family protein [Aquincola sp.]|uniref:Sel1 repeat family protein n=1 Tax=Aquincola tertiaricarbonis TaxID=391953 RepID=A0ABY4S3Z3_AQUTE|nr:sel1 repeat family protein [Aquincola tertiaricarbonis]MBQ1765561.1 sel1 repeat family protein [Aquincola sp.]URI07723.1 sel1 repeat family protein [Aquincola tertiaricarbonis]